ncbi:MAG: acyltransferase domain-containing protein, partial [Gammaproteobacteria bacterium]|nr:acyltransferase domain-containing protein [Gammaproteobacteria bacterium]
ESWSLPGGAFYGTGDCEMKLAMLFPGQGSQYPDMLLDLICQFPQLQRSLGDADSLFNDSGSKEQLSKIIYPIPVFTEAQRKEHSDHLRNTQYAQPAIGAVSLGAYRILNYFGINPDVTAGHSFGELTALYAAGRIKAEDMLRLAIKRGELMRSSDEDKGAMLAVSAEAS